MSTEFKYEPNLGVEVKLIKPFNVVAETLTRIGDIVGNRFFQEHFLLKKRERYYIVSYKELRWLDCEVDIDITINDHNLLKSIVQKLVDFGIIEVVGELGDFNFVFRRILRSDEKTDFIFKSRYTFK